MKKFYRSRHQYPTRVVMNGSKGALVIGSTTAKSDIEREIGRKLHDETKIVKRGGNWLFIEPCVQATK